MRKINKIKKIKNAKKVLLPSTFIVASFYIPILFLVGIICGYFLTDEFCKKYLYSGKINPIYINFGEWEFHFHHWISGSSLFLVLSFFNSFYSIPQVVFGAVGGLIIHDFYTDRTWHKVIYKKEDESKI